LVTQMENVAQVESLSGLRKLVQSLDNKGAIQE
jgi:hypothetical protein